MKLNLHNVKRKAGMTLLEISVVILVLLVLIGVLFIGAQAYKKGADRAACVLNLRNIQQAVRTHANTNQIPISTGIPTTDIYNDDGDKYLKTPLCPTAQTAYSAGAEGFVNPTVGVLYANCADPDFGGGAAASGIHYPAESASW